MNCVEKRFCESKAVSLLCRPVLFCAIINDSNNNSNNDSSNNNHDNSNNDNKNNVNSNNDNSNNDNCNNDNSNNVNSNNDTWSLSAKLAVTGSDRFLAQNLSKRPCSQLKQRKLNNRWQENTCMKCSQKPVPRKCDRQGLKFTRRSHSRHFHFRCHWTIL